MTIQEGSVVRLGSNRYRIADRAGRGIISQVFLAAPEAMPDTEVIVKIPLVGGASDPGVEPAGAAVDRWAEGGIPDESASNAERVSFEARVLKRLNEAEDPRSATLIDLLDRIQWAAESRARRLVVARLDSGTTDDGLPFIVMEKAPPEFRRFDIRSLHDEQRVMAVACAVVRGIALTHQHGYSLRDFEPETKGDRIRVAWSGPSEPEVKIIDWNGTGGVWDEKGETKENLQVRDLFFFGLHLYYYLLGAHLKLDSKKLPPPNLGSGSAEWQEHLSEGTKLLLQKLLHRDPRRRYEDARTLLADLEWWLETLRAAEGSNAKARLQDRLWQARSQERHERVVAAADLATRLDLTADERKAFDLWARQARSELEKEDWQPLAEARTKLLIGAFMRAAEEFDRLVNTLPAESEAARFAEVYLYLARAADALRLAKGGGNVRETPEWDILNAAVAALVAKSPRPREAQDRLLSLERMLPSVAGWASFQSLMGLAEAGIAQELAIELAQSADPGKIDPRREDFTARLGQSVAQLDRAVQKLQEAARLAPRNLDIRARLEGLQGELAKWRDLLASYQEAEAAEQRGKGARDEGRQAEREEAYADAVQAYQRARDEYAVALEYVAAILARDAGQKRALALRDRVLPAFAEVEKRLEETRKRANLVQETDRALEQAQKSILAGDYDSAADWVRQALALAPERADVLETLAWAQAGSAALQVARSKVETAKSFLNRPNRTVGDLDSAQNPLQEALQLEGRPLADITTEGLRPKSEVGKRPFTLSPQLRDTIAKLQREIEQRRIAARQVADAREKDDPSAETKAWQELEAQGLTLSDVERTSLERARERDSAYQSVDGVLKNLQAQPDDVMRAFDALAHYQGKRADELRERLVAAWGRAIERIPQLESAKELLDDGIAHFQGALVDTKRLEVMRDLVAVGLATAKSLEPLPDNGLPDWLAGGVDDGQVRAALARHVKDIGRLQSPDSWPALQSAARQWQEQLESYVAIYGGRQLASARAQARQGSFADALQLATNLRSTIQEAGADWLKLPDESSRELDRLLGALERRAQAQDLIDDLVGQLQEGKASFQAAAERVRRIQLPQHEDIPVDGLTADIAQIELAKDLEKALETDGQMDSTAYAATLSEIGRLLSREPGGGRLGEQLRHLRQGLQEKQGKIATQLAAAWQTALSNQKTRPEEDPTRLIQLYRQAAWWAATSQSAGRAPASQDDSPQQRVIELVEAMANAAAEQFREFKESSHLERVERILVNVLTIGKETGKAPGLWQSASPEARLPDWPVNPPYEPPTYRSDLDDIDRWRQEVTWLLSAAAAAPVADDANNREGRIRSVTDRAQAVLDSLSRVEQAWSALSLGEWQTKDSPMQLQMEADLHVRITAPLAEANRQGHDRQAIAGLETMQQIEKQSWLALLDGYKLWVLQNQRAELRRLFDELRRHLIGQLSEEVERILDSPGSAVERLQRDLLTRPRTRWVAQQVYDAIVKGVNQRSQREVEAGRRDNAIDLWQKVIDATEPWKAGETASQPGHKSKREQLDAAQVDAKGNDAPKARPDGAKPVTDSSSTVTAEAPQYKLTTSHGTTSKPPKPRMRN